MHSINWTAKFIGCDWYWTVYGFPMWENHSSHWIATLDCWKFVSVLVFVLFSSPTLIVCFMIANLFRYDNENRYQKCSNKNQSNKNNNKIPITWTQITWNERIHLVAGQKKHDHFSITNSTHTRSLFRRIQFACVHWENLRTIVRLHSFLFPLSISFWFSFSLSLSISISVFDHPKICLTCTSAYSRIQHTQPN